MDDEQLFYDVWIEEALRTVIKRALAFAVEHGLPGDHHFYITFKTGGGDVKVPAYIRTEHPDEMTIVIQHQFDNLVYFVRLYVRERFFFVRRRWTALN